MKYLLFLLLLLLLLLLFLLFFFYSFIDKSFQNLRSAEGAFEMLHNFKNIRSRDTINATMMKKFNEILAQFEKEVDSINQLFLQHKDNPPLSKNQPPVAGAISWSRSLFQRIKHTVLRFQTMKELIDSDAGKAVSFPLLPHSPQGYTTPFSPSPGQ